MGRSIAIKYTASNAETEHLVEGRAFTFIAYRVLEGLCNSNIPRSVAETLELIQLQVVTLFR
jgi:hypothetical protein